MQQRVLVPNGSSGGLLRSGQRAGFATVMALSLVAFVPGCGEDSVNGNAGATGGSAAKGGSTTGGNKSTGGNTSTGGNSSTGGTTTKTGGSTGSTGGTTGSTGGSTGSTGGTTGSTGGSTGSTGGSTGSSGGTTGSTGGSTGSSGGSTASTGGSTASTGGSTGSGGSTGGGSAGDGKRTFHTPGWTPASGDIWIAPDGSDSAAGTESAPLQTLGAAIGKASGKIIWVKAGTYKFSSTTTLSGSNVRISGVTTGAMPLFDMSGVGSGTSARGFAISGTGNHLRYLEIKGSYAADNCIYVTGKDNKVEWLDVHDCGDTGIQISGYAANTKVINVDSHNNFDELKNGENADGFAAKIDVGEGNEFMGCRSYRNADDGWDHWDAEGVVKLTYCWAFDMKHPNSSSASDGNGFKMGGLRDHPKNGAHQMFECFAFHNPSWGFDLNGNNSGGVSCTGCGAWSNAKGAFEAGIKVSGSVTHSTTVDAALKAKRDSNGNLPDIAKL